MNSICEDPVSIEVMTASAPLAAAPESLLAAIVDSSDDAIVSKTLDGMILSWNPAAERMFGYTREEAVGKSITIVVPEDRLDEEREVLARLRRGEKIDHFETIRRTKDGRLINILLTVSPVRDSSGKIIGASKTARDITENKRHRAQLAASQHYLQTVLDCIPECVKVLGPDGTVLRMNQAGIQMLEADTPDQMVGQNVYSVIQEKDREKFRRLNESVFQGGPGGTLEFGVTGLRGTQRTFETHVVPLTDGDEMPVGALSVTRDITSRKRVETEREEALKRERRSREMAERLSQMAAVLASELDPAQVAQKVADTATRAVGAEFGALCHNAALTADARYKTYLAPGTMREEFAGFPFARSSSICDGTFRGERAVRSDDIRLDPRFHGAAGTVPAEGSRARHTRSYLAVPVVSRTGKVAGGLFFGHSQPGMFGEEAEKTARAIAAQAAVALDNAWLFAELRHSQNSLRRTNEHLRRANEDLNQFAYSASHDLQEPLRSISIYSQLLQRKLESDLDAETAAYLKHLVKGAFRMEALVRDLLAFTQAAGIDDENVPAVSAEEALDTAVSNLKAAIQDSEATVSRGKVPRVRILPVHLAQLFQNLIGNAIKYRREDVAPHIRIEARASDGEWLFAVADNGIGIDEKYQDQIFGVFKRLHTSDEYSGTGMGLAICQRIVERAGGRIWVESRVGQGSTFYFTLSAEN
jgi:PAS domain S-box-containing protein